MRALLFLTGNSVPSVARFTVFLNTVSLVSPGAERLCKLKPFGLIDQILSTNALGKNLGWSSFKTKHFEAFLLWVLVSFESQGLLISIIPCLYFHLRCCAGARARFSTDTEWIYWLPETYHFIWKILFMRNHFGKCWLMDKFCLASWKCNVIIHVWIILRWSGLTMMIGLPLCFILMTLARVPPPSVFISLSWTAASQTSPASALWTSGWMPSRWASTKTISPTPTLLHLMWCPRWPWSKCWWFLLFWAW